MGDPTVNTHEILLRRAEHHYPQLVLSVTPRDVLRTGSLAWSTLVASDDLERMIRAIERIEQWEAWMVSADERRHNYPAMQR